MAIGEVNQGGDSGLSSGMREALERLFETTKGNPRAREEGIKELQDRIRARGGKVISQAAVNQAGGVTLPFSAPAPEPFTITASEPAADLAADIETANNFGKAA